MSLQIYQGHQMKTIIDGDNGHQPLMTRSSDGDYDLETIIVFVFLLFNFIHQRSHHSLSMPRSRIKDSATVPFNGWDGPIAINMESLA